MLSDSGCSTAAIIAMNFGLRLCSLVIRSRNGCTSPTAIPTLTFGLPEPDDVLVAALVSNRLWIDHPDGWAIVNYEVWQITKAKLAADAERKRTERVDKKREGHFRTPETSKNVRRTSAGQLTVVADFDEPDDRFTCPPPADLRATTRGSGA